MSEAAQNIEALIVQLEQARKDHYKFTGEQHKKLRKLKNEFALAHAKLWVVCCEIFEGNVTEVSVVGVSEAYESVEHCITMRFCDNLVLLSPIGFDSVDQFSVHLAPGNHIRLTIIDVLGDQKNYNTHEFHAFDTHEKAIAFLNTFNANTRNDQQPL